MKNFFARFLILAIAAGQVIVAPPMARAAASLTIFTQVNDRAVDEVGWEQSLNVEPGKPVDILIGIFNDGDAAATSVAVKNSLPSHTTFVPGSVQKYADGGAGWTAVADDGTTPFDAAGLAAADIPAGGWVFYSYTVSVDDPVFPGAPDAEVLNFAGATVDYDAGTASDARTLSLYAYPNFGFGEAGGWLSFGSGTAVDFDLGPSAMTGYVWGEGVGWISLSCENDSSCGTTNYQVLNNGNGLLSGYGWGEGAGFVSFNSALSQVTVDAEGQFDGYAWSEDVGWISVRPTATGARVFGPWYASPLRILSRTTEDTDDDGRPDRIRVTVSQNLDDDFAGLTMSASGFSLSGGTVFDTGTGAGDAVFLLNLSENPAIETDATPKISLEKNSTLAWTGTTTLLQPDLFDAGANFQNLIWGVNAADGVRPHILQRMTRDRDRDGILDSVLLVFSESVDDSSFTASDFTIRHGDDSPAPATAIATGTGADDNILEIVYSENNDNTAATTKIKYSPAASSGADLAGNLLPADPAVNLKIAGSGTDAAASGFWPVADGEAPFVVSAEIFDVETEGDFQISGDSARILGDGIPDLLTLKFSEPISDATASGAGILFDSQSAGSGVAALARVNAVNAAAAGGSTAKITGIVLENGNPAQTDDSLVTVRLDGATVRGTATGSFGSLDLRAAAGTWITTTAGETVASQSGITLTSFLRPTFAGFGSGVTALDLDADGKIDHFSVELSEPIDDATIPGYAGVGALGSPIGGGLVTLTGSGFVVGSGAVTLTYENPRFDGTVGTADDATIFFAVDEKGFFDTGITPAVTFAGAVVTSLAAGTETADFDSDEIIDTWTAAGKNSFENLRTDGARPRVSSAVTRDLDRDGQIDAIELAFTEKVNASTGSFAWTVPNWWTATGADSATAATGMFISFAESGTPDTDETVTLTYAGIDGEIRDLAGNEIATGFAIGATDGAGPVLLSMVGSDPAGTLGIFDGTGDYLELTFSESLTGAVADFESAISFGGEATPATGQNIPADATISWFGTTATILWGGSDSGVKLFPGTTTGAVTLVANSLLDSAGNRAATGGAVLVAGATPGLEGAETSDGTASGTVADGRIDAIKMIFTERIDDATLATADPGAITVSLDGWTATGSSLWTGTGADDFTVWVAFPSTGGWATDATPTVEVGPAAGIFGKNGTAIGSGSRIPTDRAGPALLSGSGDDLGFGGAGIWNESGDTLSLNFSENLGTAPTAAEVESAIRFAGEASPGAAANIPADATVTVSGAVLQISWAAADSGAPVWLGVAGTATAAVALDGSAIVDPLGNSAGTGVAAITLDPAPAPALVSAETSDGFAPGAVRDGILDAVRLVFDRAIDDATLSALAATGWTVGTGGASVRGTGLWTGTGADDGSVFLTFDQTESWPTDRSLAVALGTGGLIYGVNGVPVATGAAILADDGVGPTVLSRETADTDSDGQIDAIFVHFSENLADDFTGVGFSVAGYSVASVDTGTGAGDAILRVVLTESGTPDTAATPAVEFTTTGSLADALGQPAVVETGATVATDGAGPVAIAAVGYDLRTAGEGDLANPNPDGSIDSVKVTFSENLDDAAVAGYAASGSAALGGFAVAGAETGVSADWSLDAAGDSVLWISFTPTAAGTDAGPADLTLSGATLADAAGNFAPDLASGDLAETDAAGPVPIAADAIEADTIEVTLSENLDAGTVAAGDFAVFVGGSAVAVSGAAASGSTVTLTLPADSLDGVTPAFVLLAGASVIADAGGVPSVWLSSVGVSDAVRPKITAATTRDTDGDGRLDRVELGFSRAMDPATTSTAGLTVAGYALAGATGTWSGATTLLVDLTENGYDTGAKPVVSHSGGTLRSAAGLDLAPLAPGAVSTADGAAPVPVRALASTGVTAGGDLPAGEILTLEFSEEISAAGLAATDFVGSGSAGAIAIPDGGAATIAASGREISLTFTSPTTGGNWQISSTLNLSGATIPAITDSAGNAATPASAGLLLRGLGSVVLNEILYDPAGPDTGAEWVELFNAGATAADIGGWDLYLGTTGAPYFTFPGGTTIPAGGYARVWLRKNGTNTAEDFYQGTAGITGGDLDNSADSVALFSSSATHDATTIVDFVQWGAGFKSWSTDAVTAGIWPAVGDFAAAAPEGSSIGLSPNGVDTDAPADWAAGSASFGFNGDTTAPVIDLGGASPAPGRLAPGGIGTVTVGWSDAEENVSTGGVAISLDGTDWTGSGDFSTADQVSIAPAGLTAGKHTVSLTVTDRAGNFDSESFDFWVDDFSYHLSGSAATALEFFGQYEDTAPIYLTLKTHGAGYRVEAAIDRPITDTAEGPIPNLRSTNHWNDADSDNDEVGLGQKRADVVEDAVPGRGAWSGFRREMTTIADVPARAVPADALETTTLQLDARALIDSSYYLRYPAVYTGTVTIRVTPVY